ncbi:TetR/AcrR family transcriptional regulator [Sulfitobacter sp.]|uniref:TetR/AcrR family transcriptional regulator n=1 Tax=Sulfitobacter sp. TaxID=1903071 RepID=UPI003FCC6B37
MPTKLKVRALRKSAKRDEKKRQIAESAIDALQELGYANTSLRDIAAKSGMSRGILHYYFEDRSDLIIYCVRTYKRNFVDGIITALDGATDRSAVIDTLSGALALSIVKDAKTLGVHPCCHLGGPDKIDEHHSQVAALCVRLWRGCFRRRCRNRAFNWRFGGCFGDFAQSLDRSPYLFSRTKRQTKFFQIVFFNI